MNVILQDIHFARLHLVILRVKSELSNKKSKLPLFLYLHLILWRKKASILNSSEMAPNN